MSEDIFSVEVEASDGATVLRLAGELDLYTAPRLSAELAAVVGSDGDVVLDVQELGFLDSTGLGEIARLHRQLSAEGRRVVVRRPTAMVHRVLDISGLLAVLAVEE